MDTQNQKPGKSSKKALVIIITLVVLLVAVWLLRSKLPVINAPDAQLPSGEFSEDAGTAGDTADDQTSAINEDLEGVDLGDLEQEFKDIDEDLNTL